MPKPLTQQKPRGFTRWLVRAPIWLYRHQLGWLMGKRFLMLTHTGRKSGLPRHVVVEVVRYDPNTGDYVIASGWGERSDWYRNIRQTPRVTVTVGRRAHPALAERLAPDDAEQELRTYARLHPAAARSLARLMGYSLQDTEADFAALSAHMPIIALRPLADA